MVQFTDARPDTGGLSGATLQEGKSWGKIRTAHAGNVIVYGDSSIYFPSLRICFIKLQTPEEEGNIQKEEDMDE